MNRLLVGPMKLMGVYCTCNYARVLLHSKHKLNRLFHSVVSKQAGRIIQVEPAPPPPTPTTLQHPTPAAIQQPPIPVELQQHSTPVEPQQHSTPAEPPTPVELQQHSTPAEPPTPVKLHVQQHPTPAELQQHPTPPSYNKILYQQHYMDLLNPYLLHPPN